MESIVRSYVARRRHHASLLLWSGGNELQRSADDGHGGRVGVPIDTSPPMIARMAEIVAEMDPGRRFLPTSPSGPRFAADEREDLVPADARAWRQRRDSVTALAPGARLLFARSAAAQVARSRQPL